MKKNFLCKFLALIMVSAMALGILAGCTGKDTSGEEKPYKITMAILGSEKDDDAKVVAAINELTLRELNMTFELVPLTWDYQPKLNMMLAGGDELDILPVFAPLASNYISAGQIVNLKDYIYNQGKDILDQVGEEYALSGSIGDFLYGVPSQKESASVAGVVMRKDIVDELKIDVSAIKTLDDLTAVYAKVKAAYPEMDCLTGLNNVKLWENYDPLGDRYGVLTDNGQNTDVVNWYETDDYHTKIQRMYDWYQSGFIKLDAATSTEAETNLVKAGSLFSYFSYIKPGFLVQANAQSATEMVYAYINNDDGTPINGLNSNSVNLFNWGIAQNSKDKEKAMEFLNFAYSSPEFMNLINWGIEGDHYEFVDGSDKIIDYPAGQDATNSKYVRNLGWALPNQYIGHIWNGLPEDIWEQYKEFNDKAEKSKAFGFMYDPTSLGTEIAALTAVRNEYEKSIETGSIANVDASIKEFNDKMYAAGLQKVLDLKQEQLDAWLAANA